MKAARETNELVRTAMFVCLIIIAQILFRLPVPGTSGYVHLADAVIYLGVFVLGTRKGALAAGLGSALGDVLGGFAVWAPWSLVIKAGMAIITGLLTRKETVSTGTKIFAMILGGLFMALGYFAADAIMYGNPVIALTGVPWNIAQFGVGTVIATILEHNNALARYRKQD